MSDMTALEKRKFEKLFDMKTGYVLNFSNNSFEGFLLDSIHRSPYETATTYGGGSKANLLRGVWRQEPNGIVAKLMGDMLDYVETEYADSEKLPAWRPLIAECRKIVTRLKEGSPVAELDTLAQIADERDLDVVARAVRACIERNEPVEGLDRLHTFATQFLRSLCEGRGIAVERGKPLHSLFGEYGRRMRERGHIESEMTAAILKSLHGPLDAFNRVRNEESLAHDNDFLNPEEALLIFNHVTSALRFLRDLDARVQQKEQSSAKAAADDFDDVAF